MFIQALLIGVIGGLAEWDSRIFGDNMLGRPIILGPAVGLVLGDFTTGLIVGGTLELVFMGIVGIGSTSPADVITGGIAGTAFAILSGVEATVAATLAVPVSLLGAQLQNLVRIINSYWMKKADQYAEEGNMKAIEWSHRGGYAVFFLSQFIPVFLLIYLGSNFIDSLVNAIPEWLTDGLSMGAGLLIAIGFAMIMKMILTKNLIPFFLGGFVLAAYLEMDIIGVTVIGVIVALVLLQMKGGEADDRSV
ncbi:PTS sugar transporter subunit IIC [Oceanobacillus sp. FSL W8-0428]|uniref:PTS mannose transporter subunit IICD n=1 Tax=Oceanobacillus sojae TaxID=582851 RepID=A0A511ZI08_9BACI|nr:PTS sugar transporter subunit IIC [Oceanobacillus sojae]GEN87061.1 PTS mannose transporter subunit IICD [Oceanobacillus sojae]